MAKYSTLGILFTFLLLSAHAQYLRVEQNDFRNYYHQATNSYLLKDTLYKYGADFQEDIAIVEKNNKWGAIDTTGKEIISLKYDALTSFAKGQAIFTLHFQKGILTKDGRELISAKYDYIGEMLYDKRAVMLDGKWGCLDAKGNLIVPFIYEYVGDFREKRAMVLQNEKWGFLDLAGKMAVNPVYEWVANMAEGKAAVLQNGQYGYVDSVGNSIIPLQYDMAWDFSEGLAAVKIAGKIAFITEKAKTIIPAKYEDFSDFSENVVAVKLASTHKWGFLRKDGSQLTDFMFEAAKQMKEGRAAVKKDGKWGYLDAEGKEIIACQYAEAFDFERGYAIVGAGEPYHFTPVGSVYKPNQQKVKMYHFGYINRQGEMVIPAKYVYIRPITQDFVWVKDNSTTKKYIHLTHKTEIESGNLLVPDDAIYRHYIENNIEPVSVLKDKNGKLLTETRYKVGEIFAEYGYFDNEKGQLLDTKGKPVFTQENETAEPLDENIFEFRDNKGKRVQIDIAEKPLNNEAYSIVRPLIKGYYLAVYEDKDLYFVVDSTSKKVGEFDFDEIKPLGKAFFSCQKKGKWGILNSKGFLVLPCKYDEIVGFENDMAIVLKDSMRGYACKNDFIPIASLKEMPVNNLSAFSENLAPFCINKKYGFINKAEKVVIPCVYDLVFGFHHGIAKVRKDHKLGYINAKNVVVIPLEYEELDFFEEGLAIARKAGKVGFIDAKNTEIIPFIYQDAFPFADSLAIVQSGVNQKWGCINPAGEVKVLFNFEEISPFSEGHAKVLLAGKEGIVDKNGILVKDCMFDKVGKVKNGLSIVCYKGKFGVVNMNGQFEIQPVYAKIVRLKGEVFLCTSPSLSGFCTKNRKPIIPILYETPTKLIHHHYYMLSKAENRFIFDLNGRIITEIGENDRSFNEQYFQKNMPKPAIYNNKGNEIIAPIYKEIEAIDFSDNLFLVESDSSVKGIINAEGKVMLPLVYQQIKPVSSQLYIVSGDSLSAVVNEENEMILPPIYRNIEAVRGAENLFMVTLQGKRGAIQADSKVIIPFQYEHIYQPYGTQKKYLIARNSDSPEDIYTFWGKKLKLPPFTEIYIAEKQDLMLIKNDEQSALYDSVGNEIYPMSADEIFVSDLEDTFIPIRKGEKWGMINREGHIVALFAYDYLETVQQGAEELVIFEQGSKTGIMDTELNVLFEDTQEIRYDKTMGLFYKVGKAGYFDKNGTMVK